MKAIILAAGKGTRLMPLTCGIPKPLLPLKGKPMLDWVIRSISGKGIDGVFVGISGTSGKGFQERILSHTHGICIDNYLSNMDYGFPVTTVMTPQKETAGDILHILQEEKIKTGSILVAYGDNLTSFNVNEMIEYHRKCREELGTSATVLLFEAPEKDVSRFGIADIEKKSGFTLIKSFLEKPSKEEAPSNLANGGYYILEVGDILDTFPREKIKIEQSIFPDLASKGKLAGFVKKLPFWLDISTIEAYEEASKMAHEGMILAPPSSENGDRGN